jgi:hypothetical protein
MNDMDLTDPDEEEIPASVSHFGKEWLAVKYLPNIFTYLYTLLTWFYRISLVDTLFHHLWSTFYTKLPISVEYKSHYQAFQTILSLSLSPISILSPPLNDQENSGIPTVWWSANIFLYFSNE